MLKCSTYLAFLFVILLFTQFGLSFAVNSPNVLAQSSKKTPNRERNTHNAIQMMRLIHSGQATYQAGVGNGSFGTAEELFKQDLISDVLADALGVKHMQSQSGYTNSGEKTPYYGYFFEVSMAPATRERPAFFSVIAVPSVTKGPQRTGDYTFYIDETGVIRVAISPTVADRDAPALGTPKAPDLE